MRFTVLGSGSAGNSILVESGGTRVLVDAGFSGRDLARRLAGIDVEPASVTAIVVTHDHADHTRGIGVFARRHGTPVYLTERTRTACARLLRGDEKVVLYEPGRPFEVGDLEIEPFLTVHDAADPVGIAVVDSARRLRLGVATDLGRPTAQIRHALSSCDALVLEANHDLAMLHGGSYPPALKRRVAGAHGHLDNASAAQLLSRLDTRRLQHLVAAHLSETNNTPGKAAAAFAGVLGCRAEEITLADQMHGLGWRSVE